MWETIAILKNKIVDNEKFIEEQENQKERLASAIAQQRQMIEMGKMNVVELDKKYQKQLTELYNIQQKMTLTEKEKQDALSKLGKA